MAAPTLTATGQRFYDFLETFAYADSANGYALAYLCRALATMFDTVAELARDRDDGTPGYTILFDPATLKTELPQFLEWAAQFVGVELASTATDDQWATAMLERPAERRSTPGAIRSAARQYLTGTQYVGLLARDTSAYHYTVVTRQSETPLDSIATLTWDDVDPPWDAASSSVTWDGAATTPALPVRIWRALRAQKPAGLFFNYVNAIGQLWDEVPIGTTWDSVSPAGRTWDDLVGTLTI